MRRVIAIIGMAIVFLALAVLWTTAAGLITGAYLVANNTLDNNGAWLSTKQGLEYSTIGAYSYTRETQALAGGRLDLGAWHGYQELLCKSPLYSVRQIEFDFSGMPFSFILAKDDTRFSGILLNGIPGGGSTYFVARNDGEFESKQNLGSSNMSPGVWHHLSISVQDAVPTLQIDDTPIDCGNLTLREPFTIGFKGTNGPTLIDNVVVQRDGHAPAVESFFNVAPWRRIFRLSLIGVVFGALCVACAQLMAGIAWRRIVLSLSALTLIGIVTGGIILAYLYYYYAGTFPSGPSLSGSEAAFVTDTLESRRAEIRMRYPAVPAPDTTRILFVGSSQTFGSGAAKKDDAIVNVVERRLNQLGAGKKYECVNAAVMGQTAGPLFDAYQQEWTGLHPHTVAINLSNNDFVADSFEAALEKFIALSNEQGIKVVFILEATANTLGLAMHPIMRRVAEKHAIPLIDLHAFLQANEHRGFLWWDTVHLTSFGQRLAGEYIAESLLR